MKGVLVVATIAVALMGCDPWGPPNPEDVDHVSGAATARERLDTDATYDWRGEPVALRFSGSDRMLALAVRAAAAWRESCGVEIDVSRDRGEVPLAEVPFDELAAQGLQGTTTIRDGRLAGIYVGARTYDNPDVADAADLTVLEHEMGHAVGLGHVHDSTRLMYDRALHAGQHVTPDDCGSTRAYVAGW